MKNIFFFLLFIPLFSNCQDFDFAIMKIENQCTGKTTYDMNEPQMRFSLSSNNAKIYVVSIYDNSNKTTWYNYPVNSYFISYDENKNPLYNYSITDEKSNPATIIYSSSNKTMKIKFKENNCNIIYSLY